MALHENPTPISLNFLGMQNVSALAAKFTKLVVGYTTVNDNNAISTVYMLNTQLDEKRIVITNEKYPLPKYF